MCCVSQTLRFCVSFAYPPQQQILSNNVIDGFFSILCNLYVILEESKLPLILQC